LIGDNTGTSGDKRFAIGVSFTTASGLDKTGPRIGSNGLRGSVGVVVVGVTTFTAELVRGFTTPADTSAPIGDGTSGDSKFVIGVSIELSEKIGDSIGASGDKIFVIGVGVLMELKETGLMTGGIACRMGVAKEDKIGSTTLVGRIGVGVGTRLMMGDEGRMGTAIVVLSSGVVSAGSIAATGNVSAGIGLWTTGDRTATRGETTGETKEATGDRTGRSGTSTNDISGVGLWTTGDRAGRRGMTTADISGANEDSGATVPARVGTLILVA
jgi:hypothetical protein